MAIGTYDMTDLISATTLRTASIEELRNLATVLHEAIRTSEYFTGRTFKLGDRVRFTAKDGRTITGSVAKVNQKTVKVRSMDVLWAVTPSLLQRV